MMSYQELLRKLMKDNYISFKEAMENKDDYEVKQCDDCNQWTDDPCDMATSGGVNGEDSICEHCFEHSTSKTAIEVRRIVSENE